MAVSADKGTCIKPVRYAYRSFDRQWIIPDSRLINQPNPRLWEIVSDQQVFITAPHDRSPSNGPALTISGLIPDLHHYSGRGGRVFPLWGNASASLPNISSKLLQLLSERYARPVAAEDVFAYIAGIAANPMYTEKFQADLTTPGLRIPITADPELFSTVADIGRRVIWLHSYGERMIDAQHGRPEGAPRAPAGIRPSIPKDGAIAPHAPLPDELRYNEGEHRLHLGIGHIDNVLPGVWKYEVDRKQVVTQWFSYRKRDRSKPPMGDKRPPSPLQDIQPEHWLAEYTTDLLNLLNVLTLLVEMEPQQAALLDQICESALISAADLSAEGVIGTERTYPMAGEREDKAQSELF